MNRTGILLGIVATLFGVDSVFAQNDLIISPQPSPVPVRKRTANKSFGTIPTRPTTARSIPSSGTSSLNGAGFPTAPRPSTSSRPQTFPAMTPSTPGRMQVAAPRSRGTPAPAPSTGSDDILDLENLDSTPAPKGGSTTAGTTATSSGKPISGKSTQIASAPSLMPSLGANLKFFFDFMYRSALESSNSKTKGFDSFHQVIMAEYAPTPDFTFVTDLSSAVTGGGGSAPKFFEFDYNLTPRLQVRWGRIWIPFDDMSPHNYFGGRVNASNMIADSTLLLLPTIWADLGVGLKYRLLEKNPYTLDGQVYVVNGFGQSTSDPVFASGGSTHYPNFSSVGNPSLAGDNNNAKDYGLRLQLKHGQSWALGASYYKGVYSSKGEEKLGLSMIGIDGQLKPSNETELRAGFIQTSFDLDSDLIMNSAKRAGIYGEIGRKFTADRTWKGIFRTGKVQADNRGVTRGDTRFIGGSLQKTLGPIMLSLEYNQDLKKVAGKTNTTFWALRVVTAL